MKKDNTLNSAKEVLKSTAGKVIKSTEETAEAAIKIASDVVKKGNVQKTIDALKNTSDNIKSKVTRATSISKKTVSKKVDVKFYVQHQGKEFCKGAILEKVYKEWTISHKLSEIKTLEVYLKVEEDTAYCLVNGEVKIDVKLS